MWFSKYLKVFTGNKKGNVTEITGKVQTYDWGKWGRYSKVAELYKNANADFTINDDTPYAELWFGTHVSAPSGVKNEEKTLSSLIKENPRCLGEKIKERFGKEELPFLLKVLSIEKALSIQVHPDKASAERLHSQFPDIYKDANHKPEIAVALTPFEALCGFRPYAEIKKFFEVIPELQDLVGKGLCNQFESTSGDGEKSALKNCFHSMMTKPPEVIAALLESFLDRTKKLSAKERELQLCSLVERLNSQFPDDVGCFSVFFLNHLTLKPMQAIFLAANLPHAYLSGDCVECMACSDNVVRAGLTPKFKDVETLCSMLNYDGEPAENRIFQPVFENQYTSVFRPPVPDCAIAKIETCRMLSECPLIPRDSASILLIISGTARTDHHIHLRAGTSLFVPASHIVTLRDVSNDFLAFQAVANV